MIILIQKLIAPRIRVERKTQGNARATREREPRREKNQLNAPHHYDKSHKKLIMFYQATNKLTAQFKNTFLFRLINPRKTHLYCIGTAKSGTHSIAAIFGNQLRSAHEPESEEVIDTILNIAAGKINTQELCQYILKRDQRLWLDIDSSQLNFFLLNELVKLFPKAKFILTIRHPYPWLDSFINHQLARGGSPKWQQLRDLRFRPDIYPHSPEEKVLKNMGLYSLDGYLSYWTNHNLTVIETVPKDRLFIVRTDKISEDTKDILEFAGTSRNKFFHNHSHTFKAKAKFNVLDKLDQKYLQLKIEEHCQELIIRFFPEMQAQNHINL